MHPTLMVEVLMLMYLMEEIQMLIDLMAEVPVPLALVLVG